LAESFSPLSDIQTAHHLPCVILLSSFYLCGKQEQKTTKIKKSKIKQIAKERYPKTHHREKEKSRSPQMSAFN